MMSKYVMMDYVAVSSDQRCVSVTGGGAARRREADCDHWRDWRWRALLQCWH